MAGSRVRRHPTGVRWSACSLKSRRDPFNLRIARDLTIFSTGKVTRSRCCCKVKAGSGNRGSRCAKSDDLARRIEFSGSRVTLTSKTALGMRIKQPSNTIIDNQENFPSKLIVARRAELSSSSRAVNNLTGCRAFYARMTLPGDEHDRLRLDTLLAIVSLFGCRKLSAAILSLPAAICVLVNRMLRYGNYEPQLRLPMLRHSPLGFS